MKVIRDVDTLIDKYCNGTGALSARFGLRPSAVSNWRQHGIPAQYYLPITNGLPRNVRAHPSLFVWAKEINGTGKTR